MPIWAGGVLLAREVADARDIARHRQCAPDRPPGNANHARRGADKIQQETAHYWQDDRQTRQPVSRLGDDNKHRQRETEPAGDIGRGCGRLRSWGWWLVLIF